MHYTRTSNIIYSIMCSVRSKMLGKTKRKMADHLTEYLRSIKLRTPGLTVTHHFSLPGHTIADLNFCVVVRCYRNTDDQRKLREEQIIYRLGCLQPDGLDETFH